MTKIIVRNRLQRDFGMVPNALWASDLSFAAKGVFAYLCSFRDGAMPRVAAMEKALGLGRDARRKAFAELIAFGCIAWDEQRDARNRITAKWLEVDPLVFVQGPENQAHGETEGSDLHAPDFPAGGKSTPVGTEIRPCRDGKSGDISKQDEKRARAAAARLAVRASPAAAPSKPYEGQDGAAAEVRFSELDPFKQSRIRNGESVVLDLPGSGRVSIAPGSPAFSALVAEAEALRHC